MNDGLTSQVAALEIALDIYIEGDCDEQLFYASYLHGHVSLAFSQVIKKLGTEHAQLIHFKQQMMLNLLQAYDNKELNEYDQKQVTLMLNKKLAEIESVEQ